MRSINEQLLQDTVEIISNGELNSIEQIERLKHLNQAVQENLDLIKWLDEQTLQFEKPARGMEECLQEAKRFELKSNKDIMHIINFMDSFKITEIRLNFNLPNEVKADDVR